MSVAAADIVSVLSGAIDTDAACRAAGIPVAEFAAERDAFLRARATIGDQTFTGAVGAKVDIIRDRAGVPHIFAADSRDLYFGLGVAQAQDRLWQMDRLRRRALGRQAEILGPAYLASDIAHLTVGIDRIAAREATAMDPDTLGLIEAFVAGINRQIEAFGDALPIEFRMLAFSPSPFTARDVVAIGRGIWWSLNGRIDRIAAAEAARYFADAAYGRAYLTPEASENLVLPGGSVDGGPAHPTGTDEDTGSNNWAVRPGRTKSGHALLAGDPHQPFWVPASWYEYGLHGPEDHAAGAGHPGFPGLWWGSNGTAAWSITNNMASTRDLYAETLDPADRSRYRDGDGWRSFDERRETIPIRGAAPHELTIRATVRGPVVNAILPTVADGGDPPLSLRWVGMEHLDDLRAGIAVSRAPNWSGFRDALRDWSIAVFNFVYADRAGNVGYQMAGRIPIRGRITNGFRDPANAEDSWRGYIPFDDLPTAFNPPEGVVASANQRIVGADFPQPIYGAYSQGHRGVRLDQAFASTRPWDPESTITLQNDVMNCRAERLVPHIVAVLAGATDPDASLVRNVLTAWDFRYRTGSSAPTVFETFMTLWQHAVLGQTLPAHLVGTCMQQTGLGVMLLEQPDLAYFASGTRVRGVEIACETARVLGERLGPDAAGWNWGRVHVAHWRHPLSTPANSDVFDIGPAPVDGGSHTLRNTGGELPPHASTSGTEYRCVIDFATPDRFLAVQNIGNSGVPGSRHYNDQFLPWLEGKYHIVHLDPVNIKADPESTTTISPAAQA